MIEPRHNRILVERIDEQSAVVLTDAPKSIKGRILAVGSEVDTVRPGMKVLFNSRWNDLAHAENIGTGADGQGPLERPLSYKMAKNLHLVTDMDIFAIVPHFNFKASITEDRPQFMQNIEIKGPWNS
jgi:hypothetical protein